MDAAQFQEAIHVAANQDVDLDNVYVSHFDGCYVTHHKLVVECTIQQLAKFIRIQAQFIGHKVGATAIEARFNMAELAMIQEVGRKKFKVIYPQNHYDKQQNHCPVCYSNHISIFPYHNDEGVREPLLKGKCRECHNQWTENNVNK